MSQVVTRGAYIRFGNCRYRGKRVVQQGEQRSEKTYDPFPKECEVRVFAALPFRRRNEGQLTEHEMAEIGAATVGAILFAWTYRRKVWNHKKPPHPSEIEARRVTEWLERQAVQPAARPRRTIPQAAKPAQPTMPTKPTQSIPPPEVHREEQRGAIVQRPMPDKVREEPPTPSSRVDWNLKGGKEITPQDAQFLRKMQEMEHPRHKGHHIAQHKAVHHQAPVTKGRSPTAQPARKAPKETKALGLLPGQHRTRYETGWNEQHSKESDAVKAAKARLAQVRDAERAGKPGCLERDFEFHFTGSHLMIGERRLFHGLTNKKHILEITAQGQCYIDGTPQNINSGDMEFIKKVLRGCQ
jgi:hypothetical protein